MLKAKQLGSLGYELALDLMVFPVFLYLLIMMRQWGWDWGVRAGD